MNTMHKKTLKLIFSKVVPKTLEWKKIEDLFIALGAKLIEGDGSRIKFEYNKHIISFHRPHPQKEAKIYQVKDAKNFLLKIGVKEDEI
jgi:HicA toxin of bacterial toxin-antitoxin,